MKSLVPWDPFRMMKNWDPLDELRSMQHEMDTLFNRFLGAGERKMSLRHPAVESYIEGGKLVLKAELPGIDPKDLDVTVTADELVIKGEKRSEKDEKEKDFSFREISYGSFERRFALPTGAKLDDLKASFSNGILEISVPVPEIPKARKIEIEAKEKEDVKRIDTKPEMKKAA